MGEKPVQFDAVANGQRRGKMNGVQRTQRRRERLPGTDQDILADRDDVHGLEDLSKVFA